MKRAGQLVAHLGVLHEIGELRKLLLLQLSMRERQDQVALFRRQADAVTVSLVGAQMLAPAAEIAHRAGTVSASDLLGQLQGISGVTGDDVAFSAGQISEVIARRTSEIEASESLSKLDAALNTIAGTLRPPPEAAPVPQVQTPQAQAQPAQETAAAPEQAPQASASAPSFPEGDVPGPETTDASQTQAVEPQDLSDDFPPYDPEQEHTGMPDDFAAQHGEHGEGVSAAQAQDAAQTPEPEESPAETTPPARTTRRRSA